MRMSAIDYQLYNEIWRGNAAGVKDAIARGANVNSNDYSDDIYSDTWGWSPLMAACGNEENFSLSIVKLLLDNGAQVNERTSQYRTPLMILGRAGNCSERALNLLLDAGADINAADNGEWTFLMLARNLAPEVLELAVERGAEINRKNKNGGTALIYAASRDSFNADLVLSFARFGADFKAMDEDGGGVIQSIGYNTAHLLYIDFYERGNEEMTRYFYDIVKVKTWYNTPEKEAFALVRLALMYPETNEELEKEIRGKRSMAFLKLLSTVPDASASFLSNVLNIVTKGRKDTMQIDLDLAGCMVRVLSSVLERFPDTAVRFINKRLGAEVLEMWENEKVPGACDLNERLFALLRKRLEGMDVPFPSGYVL